MIKSILKKRDSVSMAMVLHLLTPGLGHIYWNEYLFGLFIFLITLTASVLFIVSLFIAIPVPVRLVIYGLPLLFYFFSFFDLYRSVKARTGRLKHTSRRIWVCLITGILFQFLWPLAPANFGVRNCPDIFIQDNNNLAPFYTEGDVLKASSLAYFLDVWIVNKKIIHSLPDRFELVRFRSETNSKLCGWVIGLPAEEVEMIDDILFVNNTPIFATSESVPMLRGNLPLTSAGAYSVLVVTVRLGSVDQIREVPLTHIIGKVGIAF
ncbi:MAG: hypothetical protein DRP47_09140 [Candidatus Zixiibacteriota bacterium]|nr:MAG: hypothetical protein DRP47_09140 [candidate division Zixibacteria bacterium]